jgi:hypothetical protein
VTGTRGDEAKVSAKFWRETERAPIEALSRLMLAATGVSVWPKAEPPTKTTNEQIREGGICLLIMIFPKGVGCEEDFTIAQLHVAIHEANFRTKFPVLSRKDGTQINAPRLEAVV